MQTHTVRAIFAAVKPTQALTTLSGGLLGGVGKEGFKMAKASLQYSCSHYPRDGVSEVPIAGEETRLLEEDGEGWCYRSGCSCYEVNGR